MSTHSAIIFDFPDGNSTQSAFQLLLELGYDPVRHSHTRLHIHVEAEDLTSALEIVQAYGGQLVKQEALADQVVANTAYGLDDIIIPAHIVNEDLVAMDDNSLSFDEISQFDNTSAYRAYE